MTTQGNAARDLVSVDYGETRFNQAGKGWSDPVNSVNFGPAPQSSVGTLPIKLML